MKSLQEILPRASKSFLAVNPHIDVQKSLENALQPILKRRRGILNKTEAAFALILEAQKQRGEILRFEFEGITLRFAGVRYTPDFAVFHHAYITLIEVKGPYCKGKFERAVERFRHAKTFYGDVFTFELHQCNKDGSWQRLI